MFTEQTCADFCDISAALKSVNDVHQKLVNKIWSCLSHPLPQPLHLFIWQGLLQALFQLICVLFAQGFSNLYFSPMRNWHVNSSFQWHVFMDLERFPIATTSNPHLTPPTQLNLTKQVYNFRSKKMLRSKP